MSDKGAKATAKACLLCGGDLTSVLGGLFDTRFGAPGIYAIWRCKNCYLEQTWPRESEAALADLYARHYNFGGESETLYTRLRAAFFNSPFYRLWLKLDGDISFHSQRGQGRLLDIGCNEGRGLEIYRRNGFAPKGLEINPLAADQARKKGFEVYEAGLEDFTPPAPYDVAVLSNVLEHTLDPRQVLGRVHGLLNPGGEVWISLPNAASWQRDLFKSAWINWHVPFHISHFTDRSLTGLLSQCGFKVVEAKQVSPALWAAQSLIAALFARPGRPTRALRQPFLVLFLMALFRGILFPLLFVGNRTEQGDCLVLRAVREEAPR